MTGAYCKIDFRAASGAHRDFLRVEEVAANDQKTASRDRQNAYRFLRIWNGDETDWGLNFSSAPQALRVTLGTY